MDKKRGKFDLQTSSYYIMLAPFLIVFFVFMVIPILAAVFISFTDFNMLQVPNVVGFDNYIRLFISDNIFFIALRNTLVTAVITGPVGYILSFVLAWFINEFSRPVRSLLTFLVYSPVLCGNTFVIWQYIFASDSRGFINNVLIKVGLASDPISWLTDERYNFAVVIIVTVWMSFGAGFLSFISGLQSLDRSLFEAAAVDGLENRWQELYYVTLPQMKNFLLFGAVQSISGAFSVGVVNKALTGFPSTNYSTHTLILHMQDFGHTRFEMGYASAIAVVLFIIMLGSWFLINHILNKVTGE